MIDVIDEKQMHDSLITGKEYASKEWTCVISMFLTSFKCLFFVWLCMFYVYMPQKCYLAFLGQGLDFLVKTGWQPYCVVLQHSILQTVMRASQSGAHLCSTARIPRDVVNLVMSKNIKDTKK